MNEGKERWKEEKKLWRKGWNRVGTETMNETEGTEGKTEAEQTDRRKNGVNEGREYTNQ